MTRLDHEARKTVRGGQDTTAVSALADGYQAFGTARIAMSVALVVSKNWQVTCDASGAHTIVGYAAVLVTQLHVGDPNGLNNGAGDQTIMVVDNDPTPVGQRSCAVPGDPPEVCDDGIDNDGDYPHRGGT